MKIIEANEGPKISHTTMGNWLNLGDQIMLNLETMESSAVIRERVERARSFQERRLAESGFRYNCSIPGKEIRKYCPLGNEEEDFLKKAFRIMDISARAYHRILRVARTIADLEGEEQIRARHLQEAIAYRMENIYY